ncbi:MAG: hypothetical protein E7249_02050 [Paenibacillaceae bacterium]|nr:hypothetical protein [Paenibacillaceae bacterium]
MSNLFVFGNGFDLAHGFDTSYDDFKIWLSEKYDESSDSYESFPKYNTNYKRFESFSFESMSYFFYNLIYNVVGSDWRQFEAALSKLDWVSIIENECYGSNYKERMFQAEDIAVQIRDFAHVLKDSLFKSWAEEIDISHPKSISEELIGLIDNEHDYFLNFNYTDTLEKHYNINNVCHIHGQSSKHDSLIVGHSGKDKIEFDSYLTITYSYIRQIYEDYRKDTKNIYKKHMDFFNKLYNNNITNIYIHGFSFSDVDMFYLKKIALKLDTSVVRIHLHSYLEEDFEGFKKKLIRCGFHNINIIQFRLSDINDVCEI